jgi:hypothetical protein
MAAKFDNLDDVTSKFYNTICLYDKKPVLVKAAQQDEESGGFKLNINTGQKSLWIDLDSPLFSYRDFNIGYMNSGAYSLWWFRKPMKQWQQGLKRDQMGWKSTHTNYVSDDFGLNKPFVSMLTNAYPNRHDCEKVLRDGMHQVMAFNVNFALSWDEIHNDYILQYCGKNVGSSLGRTTDKFNLIDDFKHLEESLQEALAA